jgi:hypothetical protein
MLLGAGGLIWLSLSILLYGFPPGAAAQSDRQSVGSIGGTVVDQAGAVIVGAQVRITRDDQSPSREALSGEDGQFSFADLAPGPFQLTIAQEGFGTQVFSGTVRPGEAYIVPEIVLPVARAITQVRVGLTLAEVAQQQIELAQEQIKDQEKQRVLGFIPNFYVSYVPDAVPLSPKQKYELARKSVTDPVTFVGVGALAGLEQATDDFGGYGQGAQGYAKRYGAAYADAFAGAFIGSAILPSLLKQDPRYFYRGTGSTRSRILYALGNAVICKGDNKRWQPNYSAVLGSFATGGISYLYYPANDRSPGLLVQTALIRVAEDAFAGVFQEVVLRRFTPHLKGRPPDLPQK